MRKILSIILCMALLLSLGACAGETSQVGSDAAVPTPAPTETPQTTTSPSTGEVFYELPFGDEVEWEEKYSSDPEEAFVYAMDSMISGSLAQVDTSFNYDECSYFRNYARAYAFNRVIFSQLEYEITGVTETSNEFCYVYVDFTNIDVYNVIREGMEDFLAFMESMATNDIMVEQDFMFEYMYECFIAQIGNYTSDKITTSAQVLMKYDEDLDTWQVMLSDTTLVAIVGSEDALTEYLV